MTPKQMYSELSKIAGSRCESGETFARTTLLSERELRRAQKSILALLDKLNYARTSRDFRIDPAYETRLQTAQQNEEEARSRELNIRDIRRAREQLRAIDNAATSAWRDASLYGQSVARSPWIDTPMEQPTYHMERVTIDESVMSQPLVPSQPRIPRIEFTTRDPWAVDINMSEPTPPPLPSEPSTEE